MTLQKIVDAYDAFQELSKVVLPFKKARALAGLKKKLKESFDVAQEAELAIVEEFGGTKDYGGVYSFKNNDDAVKCQKAIQDYMEQDDDSIDLPHVDLSDYTNQIRLSASALEALEGIIIFDKE